jgi:hypothetical protein
MGGYTCGFEKILWAINSGQLLLKRPIDIGQRDLEKIR